jgi:hypothetical protein
MTKEIAKKLHRTLSTDASYLGLQSIDYAYGPHLVFYRNFMIPRYRLQGKLCWVFYTMGEDDGKDEGDFEEMKELGYTKVTWEDRGAHGTIFDDFDTLEHFQQVVNFREAVAPYLDDGEDGAYELVMVLEDLSPALFNTLGAAVEALERARSAEHLAHVALSGRRYMEQLADVLFPAQEELYNGRKVGTAEYRNRIWAFIADNSGTDKEQLNALGKEADRLIEEFNAGLHGTQAKDRVLHAIVDGAKLTAALLALSPEKARQPYFAYRKRIIEFFTELRRQHERQAEGKQPEDSHPDASSCV